MNDKPITADSPTTITEPIRSNDRAFNRIVVVSTAIGFAAVLGSAACLERAPGHGFDFHWHWRALIWMTLGVLAATRLWKLVWLAQDDTTGKAGPRLLKFSLFLLAGGLVVFAYPILFVSDEHFNDVLTGLSLATAALTFVGWMIYRTVRGFNESDAFDEAQNKQSGNK